MVVNLSDIFGWAQITPGRCEVELGCTIKGVLYLPSVCCPLCCPPLREYGCPLGLPHASSVSGCVQLHDGDEQRCSLPEPAAGLGI